MKLIENKKEIKKFFLYNGKEVYVYNEKIDVGGKTLSINENDLYSFTNGVFYQTVLDKENKFNYTLWRYDGSSFAKDNFKYKTKKYLSPYKSCSYEFKKGVSHISLYCNENESPTDFSVEGRYEVINQDNDSDILILYHILAKELLFYTKTGERLWEYKVEEGREIHESGVMVVDDIVVIPCTEDDAPISVEGYNLLTGEKLWKVDDEDYCNYCYVIGPNKMLYALSSYYCDGGSVELHLCELNPFTGETNKKELKEGRHWDDIHPADTVIYGNKLFYVNQIKKEGCSVGVVDLETKELIDDTPLESQGNTVEKPIVTDDKIYVRIRELNELRIYENEFK